MLAAILTDVFVSLYAFGMGATAVLTFNYFSDGEEFQYGASLMVWPVFWMVVGFVAWTGDL